MIGIFKFCPKLMEPIFNLPYMLYYFPHFNRPRFWIEPADFCSLKLELTLQFSMVLVYKHLPLESHTAYMEVFLVKNGKNCNWFLSIAFFSNLNSNCSNLLDYWIWETSRNKLKKHSVTKIVLTFHSLNKLF